MDIYVLLFMFVLYLAPKSELIEKRFNLSFRILHLLLQIKSSASKYQQ